MARPWMLTVSFLLPCSPKQYATQPGLSSFIENVARIYGGETSDDEPTWFARKDQPIAEGHGGHDRDTCAECAVAYSIPGRQMSFMFWVQPTAEAAGAAMSLLSPVVGVEVRFIDEAQADGLEPLRPITEVKEYLN